ncbi:MAG: hypothetical protein WKG32_01355 [Gemmatimonadaceae bacterium]
MADALDRFRATAPDTPAVLAGGAASRSALVRRYVSALERSDTAALRALHLTRGEFAYLVYPSSPFARPPYSHDPALLWFEITQNSGKGLTRAMRRFGGRPLGFESYSCATAPERAGRNRVWSNCVVRFARAPGGAGRLALFGPILERDGRFKFVSYANGL